MKYRVLIREGQMNIGKCPQATQDKNKDKAKPKKQTKKDDKESDVK